MLRRLIAWYHKPYDSWIVEFIFKVIIPAFLIRTFFFGLYQVPTGSMETTMLKGERYVADKLTVFFKPIQRGEIIAFNDPNYQYSDNPFINIFQRYVWGPANFTKRVIGIPGDHVKGVIENGKPVIYLNGKKLEEPYLNKYPLIPPRLHEYPCSWDPDKPFDKQPFYKMNESEVKFAQRVYELHGRRAIRWPGTPLEDNQDIFDVHLGPNQYWVMGDNRLGSGDSRAFGPLDGKLIHARIVLLLYSIDSEESWVLIDLLKHPIDFWSKVRWNRKLQFLH